MSVYDLKELFVDDDQNVYIYSLDDEVEVFRGSLREVDDDMLDEEIMSIDNIYPDNDGYIGININ